MRKYLCKNIVLYQTFGCWSAYYNDGCKKFALHSACTRTKAEAYAIARDIVEHINRKERKA